MAHAPEPDFDNLEPLVADVDDTRDPALVTFRCPVTGTEVQAHGRYPKPGFGDKVGRIARAGALDRARIGLVHTVQRTAGSVGMLGMSMGEQAVRSRVAPREPTRPAKQREGAVVDAFLTVADEFDWDHAQGRWVSTATRSPFKVHIDAHPITAAHDRAMLARILATIVGAEGGVTDDEREMFAALAPGTDLETLIAKWTPGADELSTTEPGPTRETMLLLAWALALTDAELAARETELLDWYGQALGVPAARAGELREIAARHIG